MVALRDDERCVRAERGGDPGGEGSISPKRTAAPSPASRSASSLQMMNATWWRSRL